MAGYRKLRRHTGHRLAMLRNLVTSFLAHGRMVTTEARAKEVQRMAEKLISLAREDSVANRRQAARILLSESVLASLFEEVGPRYRDRKGGYTRLSRLGPRQGDAAPMVVLELV